LKELLTMKYRRWWGSLQVLFFCVLASPLLAGEDNLDQGWFLNACQHALTKKMDTSQTAFTSGYCYGYLEGLRHTGKVANDFVTRPELWGHQLWCIPQEKSLEDVARVMVGALKANPESSHADYPSIVMKILRANYPCP
jgi:hypothetical protein